MHAVFIICWLFTKIHFGILIIESMIVNMVDSSETCGQFATKDGCISLKKNRVFSSMTNLKTDIIYFTFYIILLSR